MGNEDTGISTEVCDCTFPLITEGEGVRLLRPVYCPLMAHNLVVGAKGVLFQGED